MRFACGEAVSASCIDPSARKVRGPQDDRAAATPAYFFTLYFFTLYFFTLYFLTLGSSAGLM